MTRAGDTRASRQRAASQDTRDRVLSFVRERPDLASSAGVSGAFALTIPAAKRILVALEQAGELEAWVDLRFGTPIGRWRVK